MLRSSQKTQFYLYVTRFTFYRLVERDNRHSFTRCFHLLLLRKSQIDTTELYLYVTLHPCICCYRDEQRFPLLLETNNAFRAVTQTYFSSAWPYNRFLCSQSLRGIFRNEKEFLKLTKCPWVRNEPIPNEQRFISLLETENASLCCLERTTL